MIAASRRAHEAEAGADRGRLFRRSPRMLFNRNVTSPEKRLGLTSLPLDEVKAVKNAFGVTVHDVVMAMVAGAVRDYLITRDELPGEPLSALCPVNMRVGAENDSTATNDFSLMWNRLPTHISDPVERLRAIHTDTVVNKRIAHARGTVVNPTAAITDIPPPSAWPILGLLMTRTPVGQVGPPITNLVISNIAGPPFPLFFAGARLVHIYGRTMVMAGVGLFVHCFSYMGMMEFGVTTLRELVPDPQVIADDLRVELDRLREAATRASA
jgi:WS/DGAT/MGAT family acyltransferase